MAEDSNSNTEGPKKQHWLPCAYLKFFAIDGKINGRNTRVYFTDGEKSIEAPVKDLAVDKYTYSAANPALDYSFNDMERDYPPIIDQILKGELPKKKGEYFGLIMTMCDFNLRNVAYENRTDLERFPLYEGISRRFNKDMFAEVDGQGADMKKMLDHLEKNWVLSALFTETEEKFITSDHPSIVFTEPDGKRPVLIYLPVHPTAAAVAFDKRSVAIINDKITDSALAILNGLQVKHSVEQVFSDHCLMEKQKDWVALQSITEKEKPDRWISETHWCTGFISISSPFIKHLTFMRMIG